jgi:hypothetical protein
MNNIPFMDDDNNNKNKLWKGKKKEMKAKEK